VKLWTGECNTSWVVTFDFTTRINEPRPAYNRGKQTHLTLEMVSLHTFQPKRTPCLYHPLCSASEHILLYCTSIWSNYLFFFSSSNNFSVLNAGLDCESIIDSAVTWVDFHISLLTVWQALLKLFANFQQEIPVSLSNRSDVTVVWVWGGAAAKRTVPPY
jgi:hypothetical protein